MNFDFARIEREVGDHWSKFKITCRYDENQQIRSFHFVAIAMAPLTFMNDSSKVKVDLLFSECSIHFFSQHPEFLKAFDASWSSCDEFERFLSDLFDIQKPTPVVKSRGHLSLLDTD